MKLGYLTAYSEDELKFAQRTGFDCLSFFVSSGSFLDVNTMNDARISGFQDKCDKYGIEISALCGYINHLDPDENKRKENNKYFTRLLEVCGKMGVKVAATNAFGDPSKTVKENLPMYKKVFSEYAKVAEDNGVRIAIENCPHSYGYPLRIGNIAYSPATWSLIFDAVPSSSIGLEFDPSHLVWLFIDYLKAARDFANRIYHIHAKDTEIFQDKLDVVGIYGEGWWRFRIPGLGCVDWEKFFDVINQIGYDDNVVIEHEDPVYEGDRRHEGLEIGHNYLRKFIRP